MSFTGRSKHDKNESDHEFYNDELDYVIVSRLFYRLREKVKNLLYF